MVHCSLVSRPLSDPLRRGLAICNTLLCLKGIQSVTQSHAVIIGGVCSYLRTVVLVCKPFFALIIGSWSRSVLCLVCGDKALPRERRVLNSTNGQIQWKVAVTEALPAASC